ncbi:betaine aldehyde dehydrogenase 1, chloroplastic-like [Durio zibethinus]|uniref:Betaine aldehyde dehydrogenase 1, chloroplastic-like n=1 Tax=Durio zibethinus TaxID=66656 RepID=A0A6P5Y534_DURZI|nr:betaine aldehyde dehydrogenase 1, chloroplastic-like [Durio zibethinus]
MNQWDEIKILHLVAQGHDFKEDVKTDIDDVVGYFEYYTYLAKSLDVKVKRLPSLFPIETFKSYVLKEPLRVIGLITPMEVIHYYGLAILKPFEFGIYHLFGSWLTCVGRFGFLQIAFTRNTITGSMIMKVATQMVKLVSLELSRKSPIILFEDQEYEESR